MPGDPGASSMLRRLGRATALVMVLVMVGLGQSEGVAQEGPEGITKPVRLAPFDAEAPRCSAPVGLTRSLTFAQDNERKFMQGVARGLELAARDRGLAYAVMQANNDAARMRDQVGQFTQARGGALVIAPVNSQSIVADIRRAIRSGAYVGSVVPPPATSILNAPQYLTGKTLGDEAAAYIRGRLKGKAKVVLLTHDQLQFLSPRFAAMRDSLKDLPDVEIVADISPLTVDEAGGTAVMRTILLAEPEIDVVLGADTVVLGALAAMRSAGKVRPDQFFGGIDGEPAAIAEIKAGSPYRATVSLASPIFAYAMGQHAADWLEGKSIPQAMDILPRVLTRDTLADYEADVADPARVYRTPTLRAAYLRMYGNICFDSRDRFLNFPWSSERR